ADLKHRMRHNKQHYTYRCLDIHETFKANEQIICRYSLSALDNNTNQHVCFDFVEIFRLENNLIHETWIMGNLTYAMLYNNNYYRKIDAIAVAEQPTCNTQITKFNEAINKFADQVHLSDRQIECLTYLLAGYTAKEIAQILGLSFRTVESYVEIIKQKHGCPNKKELIRKILPDSPLIAASLNEEIFLNHEERQW
ncbi:MAG: helix-turn-helix transcriptional regulator, partial [Gammaproteobacteria bacterium]|nr:helix-turn-helix transcriptional regulator [Gammaproteobacteria bacterium]